MTDMNGDEVYDRLFGMTAKTNTIGDLTIDQFATYLDLFGDDGPAYPGGYFDPPASPSAARYTGSAPLQAEQPLGNGAPERPQDGPSDLPDWLYPDGEA